MVCCECLDDHFIHIDDHGYVPYDDTTEGEDSTGYAIRMLDEDAIFSDHHSTYLHCDDSFWSDKMNSQLHSSDDEDDLFREKHDCDSCDRCDACGEVDGMEDEDEEC
jgi:hypothetical protein